MAQEVEQKWLRKNGKLKLVREFSKKIPHVRIEILRNGIWSCTAGAIFTRRRALEVMDSAIQDDKAPADGYRLVEAVDTKSAARLAANAMPPQAEIDRIEIDVMHFVMEVPEDHWTTGGICQMLKGVSRPGIRQAIRNLLADGSLIRQGGGMHPWPVDIKHKRRKRKSRLSDRTKRLKRLAAKDDASVPDTVTVHRGKRLKKGRRHG